MVVFPELQEIDVRGKVSDIGTYAYHYLTADHDASDIAKIVFPQLTEEHRRKLPDENDGLSLQELQEFLGDDMWNQLENCDRCAYRFLLELKYLALQQHG